MVPLFKFLGLVPYQEASRLMADYHAQRLQGKIPDTFLFLEHPPIVTMGRRNSQADLHVSTEFLKEQGVDFIETDRGGRLTYHGPGQLVVYFIVDINQRKLSQRKLSIEKLVYLVEEGLKNLLQSYGITANRDERNPGIWVGNEKIASLGFHVSRGVTTHGLALNVMNDLTPFSYFTPCGIPTAGVTSMQSQTSKKYDVKEVANRLKSEFEKLLIPFAAP